VDIDGVLIASLDLPARKRLYEISKRIFDFGVALALLLLTLPLWAVLVILIRWDSKGPAFFRQERVGRMGRRFDLYKFRTMREEVPRFGLHPTAADDPRVTRVGRWLRRTSLDELPQLLNVLKGEMSLVGPRPEMPFIVEHYNARHRQRLRVTPGLTGLWQLSADRSLLIHENIQYDLYYIRNRLVNQDWALEAKSRIIKFGFTSPKILEATGNSQLHWRGQVRNEVLNPRSGSNHYDNSDSSGRPRQCDSRHDGG
jgi:lipopolysaccharide/colanic/teichoic acid biosynthesis glycosyltransferase